MKYLFSKVLLGVGIVAPLVGAWIEIPQSYGYCKYYPSLPSWERGLKYFIQWVYEQKWQSLPSWERGLKSFYLLSCLECLNVAPLVGAWIEISLVNIMFFYTSVAPLVGAWIEITCAL